MNTRTSAQPRSPKGTPAGGRFAADTKTEPETALGDDGGPDPVSPLYGGPDFTELCECGHTKTAHPGGECRYCACDEIVDVESAICPECRTNDMDARSELCDECRIKSDEYLERSEARIIAREIADESAEEYRRLGC